MQTEKAIASYNVRSHLDHPKDDAVKLAVHVTRLPRRNQLRPTKRLGCGENYRGNTDQFGLQTNSVIALNRTGTSSVAR